MRHGEPNHKLFAHCLALTDGSSDCCELRLSRHGVCIEIDTMQVRIDAADVQLAHAGRRRKDQVHGAARQHVPSARFPLPFIEK